MAKVIYTCWALMAIMASLLTLGIARPSTGTSRTDTASPTTSQTAASPTGSCDGYWASGRRECHWSGPPGGRQCDTGDYWLTPCAGCSRAPAGVAPVGWTPPAPHQLALDQRCLVQRLEGLERNLDIYDDFQKDSRNINMLMRMHGMTDRKMATLANKFNIPKTFKCKKGQDPHEWLQTNMVSFASHLEETWKAENNNQVLSESEVCTMSKALNLTRKATDDVLCQLKISLPTNVTGTCAASSNPDSPRVACSPPSQASKDLTEQKFRSTRFVREKLVVLYFKKFLRKAKRILRKKMV